MRSVKVAEERGNTVLEGIGGVIGSGFPGLWDVYPHLDVDGV